MQSAHRSRSTWPVTAVNIQHQSQQRFSVCKINVCTVTLIDNRKIMELIWNQVKLERPPNTQWRTERENIDLPVFLSTLSRVIKDLKSQNTLHTEAAALSRLIYRMKSKFRNDKGLKNMCKVNKALLKYLSLSLDEEFSNLRNYVEVDGKYVTLPSKQMIEYVLVRMLGFAKLMIRIEETARLCGHFFKTRINLGQAWSIAVIAYAIISRIWLLSRYLVKQSCTWYSGLYKLLKQFKPIGLEYLSKDQELPEDLKLWLKVDWINKPIPSCSDKNLKGNMFKLITQRETDSDEDLIVENDLNCLESNNTIMSLISKPEEVVTKSIAPPLKHFDNGLSTFEDTGEFISRYSYQRNVIKLPTPKKNDKEVEVPKAVIIESEESIEKICPKLLTMEKIKTKADLQKLLAQESYPGLDKLQWNIIKKKINKLLTTLATQKEKSETLMMKKIVRRVQRWIT